MRALGRKSWRILFTAGAFVQNTLSLCHSANVALSIPLTNVPCVAMLRRDRKSRALLVHLCSFGGSQDPIASATCFQSAPNSLDHGACTEAGPVILAL
jgi:hypothetical protein